MVSSKNGEPDDGTFVGANERQELKEAQAQLAVDKAALAKVMKNITERQAYMTIVLRKLGIDLDDVNFKNTPKRFLSYLEHYMQPFDPRDVLSTTFPLKSTQKDVYGRGMVVQGPIPYRAACAHHLLPVIGVAHVGYIPTERVVGLSKLSRLVYGISHQSPSLQEDVGHSVAIQLKVLLGAQGSICVIEAEHGCMAARGVEEVGILTRTASLQGIFANDPAARQEFYSMIKA